MDVPITIGPGATASLHEDLLEHLAVGVMRVDTHGRISYANARAAAAFSPAQLFGMSLRAVLAAAGVSNGAALAELVETGGSYKALRLSLPGGRELECRCTKLPDDSVALTLSDFTVPTNCEPRQTGLTDRTSLLHSIDQLMVEDRAAGSALAVLCISLDRFKMVIDALGHAVGDELLAKVAERLRGAVRGADLVAHLSGEEFVVVQTDEAQPKGAELLARRLIDLIGRTYVVKGHMLHVGASVGIAIHAREADSPETLFRHADFALHRAKREGGGVFRVYEAAMDVAILESRALEVDLRKALVLGQFELVYQPQYQLSKRMVTGFEALLRWNHPVRGLVSPASFVPLAEELGLIGSIGEWVLRTACCEAASWASPVSIAVNVSPLQFRDGKLLGAVRGALAASGLAPERLDIEITEGVLLDHTSAVLNVLGALRALGVRVSMDDFGTGYSSLSYLQKFPFDKIKIDQSFVRASDNSTDSRAIISAVAALGASMGMKTVAEGVETNEQLQRVQSSGCSEVQGYLTGRPMTAAAAAALLAAEVLGRKL